MRELYPEIEPYRSRRLAVDALHTLHVEECGNPAGLPALFLHGGPGAGLSPYHRRFFDPARYRIVLFDQRGAGQSTPFAELTDNTTGHLLADIEAIRQRLGIERWAVFGGSWGSTLALAYAQAHPERTLGLVLRGIFLGRPHELRWFNEVDGGASQIYPERWARFVGFIPPQERASMLDAYWQRLNSNDEATRLAAAQAWSAWEGGGTTLVHEPDAPGIFDEPHKALSVALLEAHYFRHALFLQPDQLLRDIGRIRAIPGTIVHGRYDTICPARNAWDLSQAWPEAALHIVLAGHSAADPAIVDQLVQATDRLADRFG
ncbi:MAG: prolyl aminopeptidase [Pseudomonadota bacterium]|jgi:proline iminopeptidase|nr:prolyl aminopeptidase [Xanthomonadaceae bacterium]MDE2247602.1 prolyl aminopeptidase [Xanthomonadaceae bacterium]MDE3211086.1 prolyl aminopeptidase [Pseudomonadota bacterium]